MPRLIHYTVNTGDIAHCSEQDFLKRKLEILSPIARQAILNIQTEICLPNPNFSLKTTVTEGCAMFDVNRGGEILTSNALVWRHEADQRCWEIFEDGYLHVIAKLNLVTISRAPQKPASLPWLATIVLPVDVTGMPLGEIEECFALSLIQAATSPKGFGKK